MTLEVTEKELEFIIDALDDVMTNWDDDDSIECYTSLKEKIKKLK